MVNLAGSAIVGNDGEAFVVHIKDQILTLNTGVRTTASLDDDEGAYHDGEPNEADISTDSCY